MPEPTDSALSFTAFVLSLVSTAAIHFGDLPDPVTGKPAEPNLDGAAQMIEILALLEQKTRGNLTAEERQFLEQVLYEQNFDRVIGGRTTRDELRLLLGPPNQEWLSINGWETIWDYRYWWAGQQWVVHFGIDQKGVVTGQHRRSEINDPSNRVP